MSPDPSPSHNLFQRPRITPPPLPPKRKRRRSFGVRDIAPRQTIFDQSVVDAAESQCADVGNEVISCFPLSNVSVPQHQQAFFVWNSRRPQLTQTNLVNIYLIRAGNDTPVVSWLNQQNPTNGLAGNIGTVVDDRWFPNNGKDWHGTNISTPFYFVITRADETLDGSQTPQATFTAVQTTFADSIVSSQSSASVASTASVASQSVAAAQSSASVASLSSLSAISILSANPTSTVSPANSSSTKSPAGLQNASDSSFPHWAIAVIVVLGFLAVVAICALGFLIVRRLRQREALAASQRNSMGSASPMIPGGAGAAARSPAMEESRNPYDPPVSAVGHAGSLNSPNDDASMISHAQSQAHSTGDSGLFSSADAVIMADAFRKVLRKPDFAGRPPIEEGESPDSAEHKPENRLMNWELAEEGRDIRSVGSSRGVRVENLSDNEGGGSTSHDATR